MWGFLPRILWFGATDSLRIVGKHSLCALRPQGANRFRYAFCTAKPRARLQCPVMPEIDSCAARESCQKAVEPGRRFLSLVSQREMDQGLKSGIDRSLRLVRGFDSRKVWGTVEELDRIELRRTE
jgi:hypothetical protein